MNYRSVLRNLLLFCVSCSSVNAAPALTNEQEMHQCIDIIAHTFRIGYAPTPWKNEHFGWSVDKAVLDAKNSISAHPTTKDFQIAASKMLESLQDHHVKILFHSTALAILPFSMEKAGNRFFVSRVYKLFTPSLTLSLQRGDEILKMDGVLISTEFEQFLRDQGPQIPSPSHLAKAVRNFTERSGVMLHPMPKSLSPVTLEVRRKGTNRVEKVTVSWMYRPENVPLKKNCKRWKEFMVRSSIPFEKNRMTTSEAEQERLSTRWAVIEALEQQGITKFSQISKMVDQEAILREFAKEKEGTLLPPLGSIIWTAPVNNYFQAYIYELPTKEKVGFVRLHTFEPYDTLNQAWFEKKMRGQAKEPWDEFAELMVHFEKNADALVIDQAENGGGSSFYMLALLQHLTDKPLQMPTMYFSLNSDDIRLAAIILDLAKKIPGKDTVSVQKFMRALFEEYENGKIEGYIADAKLKDQLIQNYTDFINHWNKGETYTDLLYMYGLDYIQPHPTQRFTKPLIVLTDALDFSCADFFPAVLMDNERATIFGSRTAGAGGAISYADFPNRLGISKYSYTTTLAIRPNKLPIENLGVTPHIEYTSSAEDLANGRKGYIEALRETIHGLVHKD